MPRNVNSRAKRTRMGNWPLVRWGTVIVCCRIRKRAGKGIVVGVSVSRTRAEVGRRRNSGTEMKMRSAEGGSRWPVKSRKGGIQEGKGGYKEWRKGRDGREG